MAQHAFSKIEWFTKAHARKKLGECEWGIDLEKGASLGACVDCRNTTCMPKLITLRTLPKRATDTQMTKTSRPRRQINVYLVQLSAAVGCELRLDSWVWPVALADTRTQRLSRCVHSFKQMFSSDLAHRLLLNQRCCNQTMHIALK
eukprot:6279220-Amphidinium_carterae.1